MLVELIRASKPCIIAKGDADLFIVQGPRSNFEIGGTPLVTQYWGCTRHFFSLTFYNFKNIGGHVPPPPAPLLRGPCCPDSRRSCITGYDYIYRRRHSPSGSAVFSCWCKLVSSSFQIQRKTSMQENRIWHVHELNCILGTETCHLYLSRMLFWLWYRFVIVWYW